MGTRSKPESERSQPRIMADKTLEETVTAYRHGNRKQRRAAATQLRQMRRAMRTRARRAGGTGATEDREFHAAA